MTSSGSPTGDEPSSRPTTATRERFDWKAVQPSTAIVELVASITGREPDQLEPVYNTIDPDALDTLVIGSADPASVSLAFTINGYEVVVRDDGNVVVSTNSSSKRGD